MNSFWKIHFFAVFIIAIITSCNSTSPTVVDLNYNDLVSATVPGNLLYMLTDSSGNPTDDFQLISLVESEAVNDTNLKTTYSVQATATAFFKNGDLTTKVTSVSCDNLQLPYRNDYLLNRYLYYWNINSGPTFGNYIPWTTVINGEIISDTVMLPKSFANLSFSTLELNLDSGGVITWTGTSNGKVNIDVQWQELDSTETSVTKIFNQHFMSVPDNGYCVVSDSAIKSLQMAPKTYNIIFDLQKGNIKMHNYSSGIKQISTLAFVERTLNVRIKK